jgi:hypothetical protein
MLVGGDGVGLVVSVLSSLTVNCARIDARKWMRSKGSHPVAFELCRLSLHHSAPLDHATSTPARAHPSTPLPLMSGGSATFPPARRARARWVGRSIILPQYPNAPQYWRYLALTISMFGLQLVWSCEMSQGECAGRTPCDAAAHSRLVAASPYLLSLGLSKSMMAIVFLAGPLSGLIVQPVVGVLSDGCRSSMGRRRPFIIVGCIITSSGVLLLGWAKEVASIFTTTGGSAVSRLVGRWKISGSPLMYLSIPS